MDKHPLSGWVMIVCNPVAGSGHGPNVLKKLKRAFDENGITYAAELTSGRGDAVKLARSAVRSGCGAVVAIGGDGTLFEVVNGLMNPADPGDEHSVGQSVAVGLIQTGRGSDFGRSAGIPSDVDVACERLLAGRAQLVDLGYVEYTSFAGEQKARFFANAAGLGFDGEATVRANTAPKAMGGTVSYLGSLLATMWLYKNKRVTVQVDGDEEWRARVNSVIVANGQYFGGGMKIAPDAAISDGRFDVVVLGDLSKLDLIRNVPRVYTGSHVTHPKVNVTRCEEISVSSPERMILQADGEILGTAPARFTIVPAALRLIV